MTEKRLLYEVSIIRPLVISLLVVAHTTAIFRGGWTIPNGVTSIEGYAWINRFITGFRIETIAFIGGYVFSYQVITLKRNYSLGNFVLRKIHRLIIPCIFFGVFYMLLYVDLHEYSFLDFIVELFSGPGHLWFLPMLFWCFIAVLLLDKVIKKWRLLILLILFPISLLPIQVPFGIGQTAHFLFYFYGGYYLWIVKDVVLSKFSKPFSLTLLVLLYIILVPTGVYISSQPYEVIGNPLISKMFNFLVVGFIDLLTTIFGILALYSIVCYYVYIKKVVPGRWILSLNKLCYGIYIFHQFLLIFLYYHTGLPQYISSYILPWISLLLVYPLSLLLTKLTIRTKFGRYLIG